MDESLSELPSIALLRNLGVTEELITRVLTEHRAQVEGEARAVVAAKVERQRAKWRAKDARRQVRRIAAGIAVTEEQRERNRQAQARWRARQGGMGGEAEGDR